MYVVAAPNWHLVQFYSSDGVKELIQSPTAVSSKVWLLNNSIDLI